MNQQIMDMAQQEFNRAVMNNLGIYMIAEAWGIEPRQVVRHGNGYGLLREGFVVAEIAKQIMGMKINGSNRVAAAVRQLRRKAREDVGDMGDIGKRQAGVR